MLRSYGLAIVNDLALAATPETCYWGYLDAAQPPVLEIDPGCALTIEAITHHAGDAPDLLMDEGIAAVWAAIPEAERGPGVHIMTGPIHLRGARPGDTLRVEILSMRPRLPYGSNCAANWGLLYDTFAKERITIYALDEHAGAEFGEFGEFARPLFGFDFRTLARYDVPGVVTQPDPSARQPFRRVVRVPVRPHLGVIGVAPPDGRVSSIPPGVFGGNVDNWRFGPGATIHYPVFHEGAGFYVGDPHFAQGDGEICGTAIEASLDVTLRLSIAEDVAVDAPLLLTDSHWYTHGFGDDLDAAMAMAADQALRLLVDRGGFSIDEAYSLASVAVDFGVTQVVDGKLGCHAAVPRELVDLRH
jgi:acetamidase/formamidase